MTKLLKSGLLPHILNPLIVCNKKILLGFLFEAVNEVLTAFAKDRQWRLEAGSKKWIVFPKHPFATPDKVLTYLGSYTHRVAISNHRINSVHEGKVTFTYRDRSDQNKKKQMTLDAVEFIRRFLLNVLPDGFMKIRYYGFLSHRHKKRCVALIRNW